MLDPDAIRRFRDRQRKLLAATYLASWQHGVASYEPDPDPPPDEALPEDDGDPVVVAAVGLGGLAYLAARQRRTYKPPAAPDPARRGRSLAQAMAGVSRMTAELATLAPTQDQVIRAEGDAQTAVRLALEDWISGNGHRLNNGDSVAWAGEQHGYAQAADADGKLLEWQAEADSHVCEDCAALADMPPMPESDWPTAPGEGATECSAGCRCSLDDVDWTASVFSDEPAAPSALTPEQDTELGRIATKASGALDDMLVIDE